MEAYLEGIDNFQVFDSLIKAKAVFGKHQKVVVSISGGSDSDIVMDICEKVKKPNQSVEYIFFNTGLEYQATKDQLDFLEKKYGVEIKRIAPVKPIPTCVREYGVPFMSKRVSEQIERLQRHNFEWKDEPYEVLCEKYPKCISAIKWWCNKYVVEEGYKTSMHNIHRNKWLKEFLIANPPTFPIANKCCTYAKKMPAHKFTKQTDADLNVIGVRRSEGGNRASAYKNCFTAKDDGTADQYRPIFFMVDDDKRYYEDRFGVTHSACYTKYGFKRTGCVGCPYNKNVVNELKSIEMFEPKMYKACMKIFGKAYEYTKQYQQFCAKMNDESKVDPDQMTIFDLYYDYAMSENEDDDEMYTGKEAELIEG